MELTVEFGPILETAQRWMPAVTYRRLHLLTSRENLPLFLPLRGIQFLAIIVAHEVTFVDHLEKHRAVLRWHRFQP
ncbi:MAG: hypothetical protein G3I09_03145, partial [Ferrovum sp.]|nr:hypothetical protein [Ferrovum sp.]